MKKLLSIILAILMVATTVPLALAADEPATTIIGEKTFYQLDSANDLYWFAEYVNAGNYTANAILTENITVNENLMSKITLDEEGNALVNEGETVREWISIGNSDSIWDGARFAGEFNGNGKVVSGVYMNSENTIDGFFGVVNSNAYIHDFTMRGSYICSGNAAGFVCSMTYGENIRLENLINESTIRGWRAAGIVAMAGDGGTITNCVNKGTIYGDYDDYYETGYREAGIAESSINDTKIINCYNIGDVEHAIGGEIDDGLIINCYYLDSASVSGVNENWGSCGGTTAKTAESFASGEVAYLLNGSTSEGDPVWGQSIGTDDYPVLGGEKVYYGYTTCAETQPDKIYTNDADVFEIKPAHDWSNKDGICDNCKYACPHESTRREIIARPVQNADGTWGKGTLSTICEVCAAVTATEEVERDHEGYEMFDTAAEELEALLNSGEVTEGSKNGYMSALNGLKSSAYSVVYTEFDPDIRSMTESLKGMIAAVEAGLADGTMKKADFTYMTALFEEINTLIDNNPNNIVPSLSGYYYGPNGYYSSNVNNANLSQADYNSNMEAYGYETQLETLLAGLKDGTAVKADYTEIDEAITEIEKKLADENITDEGKAGLEDIKAQLTEMKANPITSAADVAELEKALEDYEAELDAGIEDGTLVEVDVDEIADEVNKKWAEKLEAEGLMDEYEDFIYGQKLTDEALAALNEMDNFLASLEGTVAENAENIAKYNEMVDSFIESWENCLRGTHNFKDYEITTPAKCGENAKETGTCWFCAETDERDVEGSALEHIFLDYTSNGDATCTADGTKTASCALGCGATDTVADEDSQLEHPDEDGDNLCDGCGADIICKDCGRPVHEESGISQFICFIMMFVRLVVSFIKAVI